MSEDERVKFDTIFRKIGGSWYIRVSPTAIKFMEIEEKTEGTLMTEVGEKGKYISAWTDEGEEK